MIVENRSTHAVLEPLSHQEGNPVQDGQVLDHLSQVIYEGNGFEVCAAESLLE